jgi:hypothetical protein
VRSIVAKWGQYCSIESIAVLPSRSAINFHSSRSHEFQKAHPTAPQRLLDSQQRGIFAMPLGSAIKYDVPHACKRAHGMLGIIVVPRHAVVIEECEQFVPVLFNSLFERESGLCCAFHGDDVLDESCGLFSMLAQTSRLQAVRVDSLDNLSKQCAKSLGDLL